MIDRGCVGKRYASFTVELTEAISQGLNAVLDLAGVSAPSVWPPLSSWPALLTMQGSACFLSVWEQLGVDPLRTRLVAEEFLHFREPTLGETLKCTVIVEDVSEHIDPSRGIEEQVDFAVSFNNPPGLLIAEYRCSYRILVAATV